jgi:hypothetical protein
LATVRNKPGDSQACFFYNFLFFSCRLPNAAPPRRRKRKSLFRPNAGRWQSLAWLLTKADTTGDQFIPALQALWIKSRKPRPLAWANELSARWASKKVIEDALLYMLERQRRGNSLAQANGLGKRIKNPEGLKGRDKLDTF